MNIRHQNSLPTSTVPQSINILCLNIRSLRGKINDLTIFINSRNFTIDIVILNETWLDEHDTKFFNIPNYTSFHSVRKKVGGGVSIYVLNSFSESNLNVVLEEQNANYLAVDIMRLNFTIITAYRPPSSNIQTFIENIDKLFEKNKNVFFFSDTNIDLLKTQSNDSVKLLDTLSNNGLTLLNKIDPSMYTHRNLQGRQNTLIDQVAMNIFPNSDPLICTTDLPSLDTDHKAILTSIANHHFHKSTMPKQINIKKIDHNQIKSSKLLSALDPSSEESFITQMSIIAQNHTEFKIIQNKFRKSFMNSEVIKLIRIRDEFYKLHKDFPSNHDFHKQYKKLRNKVNEQVRMARKKQNEKIFWRYKDDSRKTWRHLNRLISNSNSTPSSIRLITVNNKHISNKYLIAEAFNNFFANVASTVRQNYHTTNTNCYIEQEEYNFLHPFKSVPASEIEIDDIIKGLKNSSSEDSYGISNNFFKIHREEIVTPLTKLINLLMTSGLFPSAFKQAIVTPIFKSGDKKFLTNYRPISILPIVSKIYEKAILSRFRKYLNQNNIIHKCQFGFVDSSNTEAATLNLMNEIYTRIEKKKLTAVMFIDFTKAFDCIDINLLKRIISRLSLTKSFELILLNFLSERKQCVSIEKHNSPSLPITDGVPQGSVLGPTLFNLYINSLASLRLNGTLQLYADDSCIIYGEKNENSLKISMEKDLEIITDWLNAHGMSMNLSKTTYILFTGRTKLVANNFIKDSTSIMHNNCIIKRVNSVKYLGLFIDDDLTFRTHIKHVKKKINPIIFAIRRISTTINRETCELLYFAHIYSHLIYLNPIWTAANDTNLKTIYILQKKALRFIYKQPRTSASANLFSLRILPFPVIVDYLLIMLAFKIKQQLIKCNNKIATVKNISNRDTRRNEDFYVSNYETNFGYANFFCRGLIKYNSIDDHLKKYKTLRIFSNRLKENLLDKFKYD